MDVETYTKICPTCGVRATEDCKSFLFSAITPDKPGSKVTPDKVYTRVCQYALARGVTECINSKGQLNPEDAWMGFLDTPCDV